MKTLICAMAAALVATSAAAAGAAPIHGLWVWKSPTVLQASQGAQVLNEFCRSTGITEVYVSVPAHPDAVQEKRLAGLIALLHGSAVRVEALISSVNADEEGGPRNKLLDHVQWVVQFNRKHAAQRFDGIHLDIEPQQRPENKGAGNLAFLPGLTAAYRDVRLLTDHADMTLNADIQNKLLKGDLEERRAILSSVPRVTLMLYELSSPDDGATVMEKVEKIRQSSARFLDMAYQGLASQGLAHMSIALRTPDYGPLLPQMLASLDAANATNPHYLGWARHSYNDVGVLSEHSR
jgi:hypothetical protein